MRAVGCRPFCPAIASRKTGADKAGNPIDPFILARLENEGVESTPVADKATLLRRLSLDLTGLPPLPQELDAFLADASPDAYAKQVERLLASPRYGERMATFWLDVTRFSDTAGYHGDQNTRIFPYRDYVIRALNDNMPFDRFTREQLAGDLMENPTEDQHIATGFLRLNMITREGGAQPAEYIAKYTGDRICTLGGAWLGLTTGCAECHDHKFDPITSKDYYSLGAFFSDIRQWGVYSRYSNQPNPDLVGRGNNAPFPPERLVRSPALEQRIRALQGRVVGLLAGMREDKHEAAIGSWTQAAASFLTNHPGGWSTPVPSKVEFPEKNQYVIREDRSVVITGAPQEKGVVRLHIPLSDAPIRSIRSIRFEALPDDANAGKVGCDKDGRFEVKPASRIKGEDKDLKIAWAQADRRRVKKFVFRIA